MLQDLQIKGAVPNPKRILFYKAAQSGEASTGEDQRVGERLFLPSNSAALRHSHVMFDVLGKWRFYVHSSLFSWASVVQSKVSPSQPKGSEKSPPPLSFLLVASV